MRFTNPKAVFAAALLASALSQAGTIFDTGSSYTGLGSLSTDAGVGQGFTIQNAVTLEQIAFYLNPTDGAELKFMIWNGANSALLFSTTLIVPTDTPTGWVYSDPFSFDLEAGSTYYFGIVSNAALYVGYIYPSVPAAQNGVAPIAGNVVYQGFASPSYVSGGDIVLNTQLIGTDAASIPEPATVGFVGFAVAGGALLRRKRAS